MHRSRNGAAILKGRPLWGVTVGSCATGAREPSQGREAAALSGACRVPQIAWPSLPRTGAALSPEGPDPNVPGTVDLESARHPRGPPPSNREVRDGAASVSPAPVGGG